MTPCKGCGRPLLYYSRSRGWDKCGYCRKPWRERLKLRVYWMFHGRNNV